MNYILTNGKEQISFGAAFILSSYEDEGAYILGKENAILNDVGYLYSGSQICGKRIVLKGYIVGTDIETKKRLLNRICTPSGDYFYLKEKDYQIKCRLYTGIEYKARKHIKEKTLEFKITLFCPYPLWEDKQDSTKTLYSCSSVSSGQLPITIENNGDIEIGVELKLTILLESRIITIKNGDKSITIRGVFSTGDAIYINTRRGNGGITALFKGGTERKNIMGLVDANSEFFMLNVGKNDIEYEFNGGSAHIYATYRQEYLR